MSVDSEYFMKKPCKQCPYRNDVKPYLRPERGEELAYHANNQYNSFTCHKTLEHDESGDVFKGENSKECAGFLSLLASIHGEKYVPDGFVPDYENCYNDPSEMIEVYDDPDFYFPK